MKRILFDTAVRESPNNRYLPQTQVITENLATGGALKIDSSNLTKAAKASCSIDLGSSGINNVRAYGIMVGETLVQEVATGAPVNFANGTELAQAILFDLFGAAGFPFTAVIPGTAIDISYTSGSVLTFMAFSNGSEYNGIPIRILLHVQESSPAIGFYLSGANGQFQGDIVTVFDGVEYKKTVDFSATAYTVDDLANQTITWLTTEVLVDQPSKALIDILSGQISGNTIPITIDGTVYNFTPLTTGTVSGDVVASELETFLGTALNASIYSVSRIDRLVMIETVATGSSATAISITLSQECDNEISSTITTIAPKEYTGKYSVFNDGGDSVFVHKSNTNTDVTPFTMSLDYDDGATNLISVTANNHFDYVPSQSTAGGQTQNYADVRLLLSNELTELDLSGNLLSDINGMTDPTDTTELATLLVSKINALADFAPNGAANTIPNKITFGTTTETGVYNDLVPSLEVVVGTAAITTSEATPMTGGSNGINARTPDFATIPKPRKGFIGASRIHLNGFLAYYLIDQFPAGGIPETQQPYWEIPENVIDVAVDGFGFQDFVETFTSGEYFVVFSKLVYDPYETFISNTPADHLVFKIHKHAIVPDMLLITRVYFADPMKTITGFAFTEVEEPIIEETDGFIGLNGRAIVLTYAEQGTGALAVSLNDVVDGALSTNHQQKIITGALADSIDAWANGAKLVRGVICNTTADIILTHCKTEGGHTP